MYTYYKTPRTNNFGISVRAPPPKIEVLVTNNNISGGMYIENI